MPERKIAATPGYDIVVYQPATPGTVREHRWCQGCDTVVLWGAGPDWLCDECLASEHGPIRRLLRWW